MGGVEVFQLLAYLAYSIVSALSGKAQALTVLGQGSIIAIAKPPLTPQFSRSVLNKKTSVKKLVDRFCG